MIDRCVMLATCNFQTVDAARHLCGRVDVNLFLLTPLVMRSRVLRVVQAWKHCSLYTLLTCRVLMMVGVSFCFCTSGVDSVFTFTPQPKELDALSLHPSLSHPNHVLHLSAHHQLVQHVRNVHNFKVDVANDSTTSTKISHKIGHKFSTLQMNRAESNLTGCSSIDFSALVTIGEGDDAQTFRLIVDTGSTTLAVVSSSCQTCDNVFPVFTPSNAPVMQQGVSATYGGGTGWVGQVYNELVGVGNSKIVNMALAAIEQNNGFISSQSVCAINSGAKTGLNTSQGIIGFAFPLIAVSHTDSWITNYVEAYDVSNEFTLQLCPQGGNLWIGGWDPAFVSGPFVSVPIVQQSWYSVLLIDVAIVASSNSSSLGFDSTVYGRCQTPYDCTIVDSGTTKIILPSVAYNSFVSLLQQNAQYQAIFQVSDRVDPFSSAQCQPATGALMPNLTQINADLPKMKFSFSDASGDVVTELTINAIPGYLTQSFDDNGQIYYCAGVSSTSANTGILGFSFINQFTVRYDLDASIMEFAPTQQCGVAATPLPNFIWITGDYGSCSTSCGGGVAWRQVLCRNSQNDAVHSDFECAISYTGPKPPSSQPCNTQECPLTDNIAIFTSISINESAVTQGLTYVIDFSYNSTFTPSYVVLIAQPSASMDTSFPSYIARNASAGSGGRGSFLWTVPSTLFPGTYFVAAFAQAYFGYNQVTTANPVTVSACPSGCSDPCTLNACNNNGRCNIIEDSASCECVGGWSGAACTNRSNVCSIQCQNAGVVDESSCSCLCQASFSGPLCERRYLNMSATLRFSAPSTASVASSSVFSSTLIQDLAFAVGASPSAVSVQSVGMDETGEDTLVLFSLSTQGNLSELISWVNELYTQSTQQNESISTLSSGVISVNILFFNSLSASPADLAPLTSTPSFFDQYQNEIYAGCGVIVLLLVLYLLRSQLHRCCCGVAPAQKVTYLPSHSVSSPNQPVRVANQPFKAAKTPVTSSSTKQTKIVISSRATAPKSLNHYDRHERARLEQSASTHKFLKTASSTMQKSR